VFGNRVLERMFRDKRGKIIRGWKKLHNNYTDQVKDDAMGRECSSRKTEVECMCVQVGRKPQGRSRLKRPRHRWEHIIKMDLRKMVRSVWTIFI
jgi:hypothetical protein